MVAKDDFVADMSEVLKGQTAVVTGSSSGIGRAIALELAGAGAHVLVHARRNGHDAEQVPARRVESNGFDRAGFRLLPGVGDEA